MTFSWTFCSPAGQPSWVVRCLSFLRECTCTYARSCMKMLDPPGGHREHNSVVYNTWFNNLICYPAISPRLHCFFWQRNAKYFAHMVFLMWLFVSQFALNCEQLCFNRGPRGKEETPMKSDRRYPQGPSFSISVHTGTSWWCLSECRRKPTRQHTIKALMNEDTAYSNSMSTWPQCGCCRQHI